MEKLMIIIAVITLAACTQEPEHKPENKPQSTLSSKQVKKQTALNLADKKIRLSYAMGLDIAKSLNGMNMQIDKEAFMQAFEDFQKGRESQLSSVELYEVKQDFFNQRNQTEKK